MRKVLILMLVFATFGFAAQTNMEGDVLLTPSYKVNEMAAVAAGIEGFDVGTKASAEVVRDLWAGSDFDADGNKEVLLASYEGGGKAYVYEIDGDNNATLFFETEEYGGVSSRDAKFGDLDGNGMQELIVAIYSSTSTIGGVWVYEYDTVADSFLTPVHLFSDLVVQDRFLVEHLFIDDADGDGVEEIIFGRNGSNNAYDNFHIWSVESGTFAADNIVMKQEFIHGKSSATFPIGGSPYGGVTSDLDGDGKKEILFAPWDNGAMLIVTADSADSYTAVNYIETDMDGRDDFAFWNFLPYDLDGDGRDEAYLSMYDAGRLYVTTCPEGTALADMTTANVHTIDEMGNSGGVSTQIGDLDGNGRMNIYASGGGSYLTVHEFIGTDVTDSTHWVKQDDITTASFKGVYGMVYAGDLDGDGLDEIYGANTGTSTIACAAIENVPPVVPEVFFSEYIEGSGNNKAIEVYNGTDATINLDDYRIAQSVNGNGWQYYHTFPSGATLAAGDVWVILNDGSDSALVDYMEADEVLGYPSVVHHNGDDARAVQWAPNDSTWYTVDVIGWPTFDPGSGWDVAGVENATANHTLIRKRDVVEGNMDWADAAGTSTSNSEWEVFATNTMMYLGEHPSNDYMDAFADGNRVYKWYSANSGWTSRIWADGDTCLTLSDGGWTIDARMPVYATPGTFFKATVVVKTGGFADDDGKFLEFGVDGLMAVATTANVDSTDEYTEFSVIGYSENAEGTLYFFGQSKSGAALVYIDEVTFEDDYMSGLVLSDVVDARMVTEGEMAATKGVVTATTQFGAYGGPIYLQDNTAGIAVYEYGRAVEGVEEGDEILVIGEMDSYNGLLEIVDYEFAVLSTGNVVTPTEVTWDDIKDAESYEGQLVVMKGCDTVATGQEWAETEGSNKGFDLLDKNDSTFYCYVDKDTDIDGTPLPTTWPMNITGIVGDYRGAQLLPRSLADFNPNTAPADFMMLNPADDAVITSLDDPEIEKIEMDGDSVYALFMNWTEAVDPDAGDTVTYQMMFIGDGPDDVITSVDTFMYIPINDTEPYGMNGVYTYYMKGTDLSGESAMSDTQTITFDFPAPPRMMYSDIVLLDGVPTWYAQFDLDLASAAVSNFKVLDYDNSMAEITPTAIAMAAPNAVMVTAPMDEDGYYALIATGLTAPSATVSVTDTSRALKAYIPFSDAHPEDAAKQIESFNTSTGLFWDPNGSGSTRGVLDASALTIEDSVVYNGAGAAALTLLDDPAVDGGWYVRLYHTLSHTVKSNSEILLMVKGVGDVDIRLSLKDTGYEQGPWKHVSLCENDWQVVSFDLVNDEAEGWITGNGIVEGESMLVEAIHVKSDADEDVVLFLDGFTERQVLEPVNITLNVMMDEWLRLEQFNLATDFVDVAGSFNDWGGTSMILDDFDGDTTYSIVVPMLPYRTEYFKFRINGSWNDLTAEFPYGGPAREISVRDYDRTYTYWYNDDTLQVVAVDAVPAEFALHQNYPNPFNPTTTINFDLPEVADVKLTIYDITGRKVRTLVNESSVAAGYLKINWNGRDDYGNGVSTGMYIYRLVAGDYVDVKKMTFLK